MYFTILWPYCMYFSWTSYTGPIIIHTYDSAMFFPRSSSNDDVRSFWFLAKIKEAIFLAKSARYAFYIFSHIIVTMTATVMCHIPKCSWRCVIKSTPIDGCHAKIGTCLNHITLRSMHVSGYCQICPSILYFAIHGQNGHKYIFNYSTKTHWNWIKNNREFRFLRV